MKISIDDIKKLREETGAGIADCRVALEASGGSFEQAKQWLNKKGLDKASEKSGREVKAGLVEAYVHSGGKIGAMVSLGSETDFVARTEEFRHLAHEIAMQVASMDPKDKDELLKQPYIRDNSVTIGDLIKQSIAKLGENIQVLEFSRSELGK